MAVVSVKPTLQIMALELPAASAHNRGQPRWIGHDPGTATPPSRPSTGNETLGIDLSKPLGEGTFAWIQGVRDTAGALAMCRCGTSGQQCTGAGDYRPD